MRWIGALALGLLLLGCADPAAHNHGYGWHYDAEGPTGLRLRYDAPVDPGIDLAWFETRYRETAACLGLTPLPRGPFVIVVPYDEVPGPYGGYYWADPPLVLVSDGGFNPGFRESFLDAVTRHEFVHALLGRTDHAHPGFAACG